MKVKLKCVENYNVMHYNNIKPIKMSKSTIPMNFSRLQINKLIFANIYMTFFVLSDKNKHVS